MWLWVKHPTYNDICNQTWLVWWSCKGLAGLDWTALCDSQFVHTKWSIKLLHDFFMHLKSPMEPYYFYTICSTYKGPQKILKCDKCQKDQISHFVVIPVANQMKSFFDSKYFLLIYSCEWVCCFMCSRSWQLRTAMNIIYNLSLILWTTFITKWTSKFPTFNISWTF